MKRIVSTLKKEKSYRDFWKTYTERKGKRFPILVSGLSEGAIAAFYTALLSDLVLKEKALPALCILPTEKECARLAAMMNDYHVRAVTYTVRDMVFQNIVASHEFEHERLAALDAVLTGKCDIVLTTPDAAMQYTMPPETLKAFSRTIASNEEYDPEELCRYLSVCGYTCTDMVDSVGQYSRRGGILDIYPPNLKMPVRLEFFDREIDRMTHFDIITQRYSDAIESFYVTPVREVISSDEQKKALAAEIRNHARKVKDTHPKELLYAEVEALTSDRDLNCIDKYISFVYPEKKCLLDYFSKDSLIVIQEYTQVMNRATAFEWQENENKKALRKQRFFKCIF